MPDHTPALAPRSDVQGWTAPGFEGVRDELAANLATGADVGASVCAVHQGTVVVDVWGGLADKAIATTWQRDTIVNTWSITKTMTALCALLLVDAGELDLDAPVARYWPQFAAAGKDGVLVRHLLGHTSGLAGWQRPVTVAEICDVPFATELVAEQEPWWTPGDGSGYHTISYGHLVGEVVRRITGRTLGDFFRDSVAQPLDADFHIGTPAEADDRIAALIAPESSGVDYSRIPPDSFIRKSLLNPPVPTSMTNETVWRRAELGGANGHGNARSVAAVQALVSCGEAGPLRLSSATRARIFDVQADGVDRVLMTPIRFGIGFALSQPRIAAVPSGRVCWWTGAGGSVVVNDLDRQLTVAYVMNRMDTGLIALDRAGRYIRSVYSSIDETARG